jgi:SAM-dependent methyltransferase
MKPLSGHRSEILFQLAPRNLMQPATALWRVYEIEAVQQHVHFRGRVLDLGCGDGSLSRVVFGAEAGGCTLVGIEPDSGDAERARRAALYQTVHHASGASIPETDGSFDMVFSNSVLEHIREIEQVLSEVGRVLKPGGKFILTVPSDGFQDCLAGGLLMRALARRRGETTTQAIDRRLQHHRYWSAEEWHRALDPVKLRIEAAHRYFPRQAVQSWERISNWTGGLAFELFQRSSETRALQRKMRLDVIDALVPTQIRWRALKWILGTSLGTPAEISPGEPSGGLLVVAEKY